MNSPAFVVPVYRHARTLEQVLCALKEFGCGIIVVDDGNCAEDKIIIEDAVRKCDGAVLASRRKNGGKGKAVCEGVRRAQELGFTHVFQIDSDGQHDIGAVKRFLSLSEQNPASIICGCPEYDESAPAHRLGGHKFANAWIHIVTLCGHIKDAMIGFRIYPVGPFVRVMRRSIIDARMGFDIDILARLSWLGVDIISSPVKIRYPADGISNFRAVRDNVRISLVYTRLCLGMIPRLPLLVFRAIRRGRRGKTEGKK